MQEVLVTIENNSTLMLTVGVALAVLLIILLVTVVSAMKVKTYKDRYWNTKIDNEEKTAYISTLEGELEACKVKNRNNEEELEAFAATKERFATASETLSTLKAQYSALEKELGQVKLDLEKAQQAYTALQEEHDRLKEQHNTVLEDNSRYRTNNARLLMKLESLERQSASRTKDNQ